MRLDYWPLGRYESRPASSLVAEKVPLAALAAGAALVAYLAQESGGAVNPIPLRMRVENALTAYAGYMGKALRPHPLAIFYPHPGDIGMTIPAWKVAGASLLLAGVTALAIAAGKRHAWFPVGWSWFLGTLVPVIGIVQVGGQAMADRHIYMPIVGLAVTAAWGAPCLHGERAVCEGGPHSGPDRIAETDLSQRTRVFEIQYPGSLKGHHPHAPRY